jgi:hypothetical protein
MVDLAGEGSLVQSLDVALREHVDRAADIDLDEATDSPAHLCPRVLVRRDGGGDGDHTIAREQLRHESDAADVDVAVFLAEAQPRAERLPHLVAVEDLDIETAPAKLSRDPLADRRFAGSGKAREPDREPGHEATVAATA